MTKTLARRLNKLEEQLRPGEEPKVWQVVYVGSDGSRENGPTITWSRRKTPTRARGTE
jgi:hypothetical protein